MISDCAIRLFRGIGCLAFLCFTIILPVRAEDPAKPLDNWGDLRAALVR